MLIGLVLTVISLGGLGFFLADFQAGKWYDENQGPWYSRLLLSFYWAVVTITTTGYGDFYPLSPFGRLVAIGVMLSGLISISLITATVASIFVERKFRRERGLEPVTSMNHLLILGWHDDGVNFLEQLLRRHPPTTPVVLVNLLPPERLENLKEKFSSYKFSYLYGDYSREDILEKAAVRKAAMAIILACRYENETAAQVDQRSLLTALTLKSLNPKIRIVAEILLRENRPYLERAGVDDTLLRGQYDSSLLAGKVANPGLYFLFTSILTGEVQNIWSLEVPARYHGRPLKELSEYLKENHQALVLAIFSEGRAISLEDLLSDESSPIDNFIRTKFTETGMTHLFGRAKFEFQLNPPDDFPLAPRQQAVVIAPQKPVL